MYNTCTAPRPACLICSRGRTHTFWTSAHRSTCRPTGSRATLVCISIDKFMGLNHLSGCKLCIVYIYIYIYSYVQEPVCACKGLDIVRIASLGKIMHCRNTFIIIIIIIKVMQVCLNMSADWFKGHFTCFSILIHELKGQAGASQRVRWQVQGSCWYVFLLVYPYQYHYQSSSSRSYWYNVSQQI